MQTTKDAQESGQIRTLCATRPSGRMGVWRTLIWRTRSGPTHAAHAAHAAHTARTTLATALALLLVAGGALAPLAWADGHSQAEADKATRLARQGDRLLKAGQFFPASERYSAAVLANPSCGWNKIAFGHALFALGRYAYASFNFRRGVRYMEYPTDLAFDIDAAFPSRQALDQALAELHRYLGYYPGDYHALTALAHVSFFRHDRSTTRNACLQLLKQNPRDPFALYLLRRMQSGRGERVVAKATVAEAAVAEAAAAKAAPPKPASPAAQAALARPIPDPEGAPGAPALVLGRPRAAIARPAGQ